MFRGRYRRVTGPEALLTAAFLLAAGCGGGSVERPADPIPDDAAGQPQVSSQAEGEAEVEGDGTAAKDDEACLEMGEPERLTVEVGGSAATASGLTVSFEGASHDSFDDGGFDTNIHLELTGTAEGAAPSPWMPSAHAAPAFRAFGDFCVRLAESSDTAVTLDVAPLSSKPLPTCAIACCPPNLQIPAPDGTIECCFCKEE